MVRLWKYQDKWGKSLCQNSMKSWRKSKGKKKKKMKWNENAHSQPPEATHLPTCSYTYDCAKSHMENVEGDAPI